MRRFMREHPLSDIVMAAFNRWVPLGLAEYPTAETGGPERIYIRAAELRALVESAYRAGWGARETSEPPRPCPDCGSLLAYSHCDGCPRGPAPGPDEPTTREIEPESADWHDPPDPEPYDPGPEIDDEGGMSEYRHVLPDDPPNAF
jgi:hypothetical protein